MAAASFQPLLLLLLFVAKGAAPGTCALLGATSSLKSGLNAGVALPQHPQHQHRRPSPSQPAFVSKGAPVQHIHKHWDAPALASATGPQAAACVGSGCRIIGVGSAVPELRITNDDLAQIVDTNDEWIRTRTGISARRVLRHGERLRELALRASREAISTSGLRARDIDLLLHSSSSPDDLFGDGPALGAELQDPGDPGPPAFDITAACSGFVVGLVTANMYLTSPGSPYKRVLLVGSDALSRWVDWSDRNTCILFGDGAGAAVLAAPEAGPANVDAQGKPLGLLSYVLHSDGAEQKQIKLSYEGAENPLPFKGAPVEAGFCCARSCAQSGRCTLSRGCYSPMSMNGREVFKFVSRKVPGSLESVLASANLQAGDIDWLLMHQANKRIIDAVAERLEIPRDKVLCNLEEYGNTSAASVPLCLSEAVRAGKVKKGDVIAIAGFGAGLTWAAAVLRYG